jgi:hypothetical protein
METPSQSHPNPQQLADLSALADGSLAAERGPEVEAMIAASAELQELFTREQQASDALRQLREHDRAPLALKQRIDAARPSQRARRRQRLSYAGALAGGLAVIALVLVLALPGGTPGSPSFARAAALGTRPAVAPAPGPAGDDPQGSIAQNVGNVYFPDWTKSERLNTVGRRSDRIAGRTAVTVFYAGPRSPARIAYTIVSAPQISSPNAQQLTVRGLSLRKLKLDGRTVVTWVERHHTCILSAAGTSPKLLEDLAVAEWQRDAAAA